MQPRIQSKRLLRSYVVRAGSARTSSKWVGKIEIFIRGKALAPKMAEASNAMFSLGCFNSMRSGGFMFAVQSRICQFGLMLAVALAASLLPTAGQAYTPEQQQACTPDAFRLCGDAIPDVDRITLCMMRNRSQLSPGCRAFFRAPEPPPVVTSVSVRKPVRITPATMRKPVGAKSRKTKKARLRR
jgi:hypothetical protein